MFKQLSPRGVILPLNYRNTVPGPSSVFIYASPWALCISWEWQSLFFWSSRKGVGLGARMGLFWRVFRTLQDLGQSNTFLSTDIYFIIFKFRVHSNLAAKKSMWKHHRKIISENIWLPCDSYGISLWDLWILNSTLQKNSNISAWKIRVYGAMVVIRNIYKYSAHGGLHFPTPLEIVWSLTIFSQRNMSLSVSVTSVRSFKGQRVSHTFPSLLLYLLCKTCVQIQPPSEWISETCKGRDSWWPKLTK